MLLHNTTLIASCKGPSFVTDRMSSYSEDSVLQVSSAVDVQNNSTVNNTTIFITRRGRSTIGHDFSFKQNSVFITKDALLSVLTGKRREIFENRSGWDHARRPGFDCDHIVERV